MDERGRKTKQKIKNAEISMKIVKYKAMLKEHRINITQKFEKENPG